MNWYDVLKAARRLAKTEAWITSATLAVETGLKPNVASAWLSNFFHWGYVLPIAKEKGRGRPMKVYRLTKWGLDFRPAKEARVASPLKKVANPKKG